jgi:hypothetical protein
VPDSAETPRRPRRAGALENVTVEIIQKAAGEMADLVRQRAPLRVWHGEGWWRLGGQALVARCAGLAESIALLAPARRPSDTIVLVRALYEPVTMFCWAGDRSGGPDSAVGRQLGRPETQAPPGRAPVRDR